MQKSEQVCTCPRTTRSVSTHYVHCSMRKWHNAPQPRLERANAGGRLDWQATIYLPSNQETNNWMITDSHPPSRKVKPSATGELLRALAARVMPGTAVGATVHGKAGTHLVQYDCRVSPHSFRARLQSGGHFLVGSIFEVTLLSFFLSQSFIRSFTYSPHVFAVISQRQLSLPNTPAPCVSYSVCWSSMPSAS